MIRTATAADMPSLRQVYAAARRFMADTGNPYQWGNTKPTESQLEADILHGQLYVEEIDGRVCAAFALVMGEDPTYGYIEGAWQDHTPYGTIHRLAADGTNRGFFARCVAFSARQIPHLRIDTHRDNRVMRHLIEKHGFTYCGVIYLENGDPRLAFERLDLSL